MLKLLLTILCMGAACAASAAEAPPENSAIRYEVNPSTILDKPWRVGMNLGSWTSWGAEQFMRNVIQNPGFEGYVDRWVVFSSASDGKSFSDQGSLGLPDGYWNGAEYEVRTGNHLGAKGSVARYVLSGAKGSPQFFVDAEIPPLGDKDMVVITKTVDADPVPIWWIPDDSKAALHVDKTQNRPGTRGSQSLRMEPQGGTPARLFFYLDGITDRAGKLLPVTGAWKLSIWAKSDAPGTPLQITFKRLNNTAPFVDQTIQLSSEWQEYILNFNPDDDGPPAYLQLSIASSGPAKVWIDDIYLGKVQSGRTAFRKEVVDALKILRPSFLRDSGVLGDTYANRMATPSARRAWVFHVGGENTYYSFSIPDHLALSKEVNANPWIIVPVTWSDDDYQRLGKYLGQAAQAYGFSQIIVEFGNENWNWVFRPQSIPFYEVHGVAAERAFQFIKLGAAGAPIKLFINGQDANPWLTNEFLVRVQSANAVATAPYYYYTAESGITENEALKLLFETNDANLKANADNAKAAGKEIGIYELNAHTTLGAMPGSERDTYVVGLASGTAFAQSALKSMLLGYNPIMASNLAQYDVGIGSAGRVKLWGMMRDIIPTKRLRPSGMAMMLLNSVIDGKLHSFNLLSADKTEDAAKLTLSAFEGQNQWTAAITSSSPSPVEVELHFPDDGKALPVIAKYLAAESQRDTNEEKQLVTVKSAAARVDARNVTITVPAYGFVILAQPSSQ